jgi:uncharacterized protein
MVRHRSESYCDDAGLVGVGMSQDVTPVSFLNRDGLRLFGILHRPTVVPEQRTAILLLSPGVKMRVAPHRLYNNMAERFTALGFPVLRFDFYGLGDSEGESTEQWLVDLYGAIQVGRYIGDTIAAMDWMEQKLGVSHFIASGLCGGAITGLLTGAQDSRVAALLGLAIPVTLDGSHIDSTKYITDAQLTGARDHALKTALKPGAWHAWVRFFTFQCNYRLIFRSIFKPLLDRIRPLPVKPPQSVAGDNTNPHFAPAFFRLLSTSRKIYLVFAGADRHWNEFEKKFIERHRATLEDYRGSYEVHVTKQSNHIFSFREWEEDMLNQCCLWLREFVCSEKANSFLNR